MKQLIRKTLVALALTGTLSLAHASNPGLYVGGQMGLGNVHQNKDNVFNQPLTGSTLLTQGNSHRETGLAGRLFSGYQFNRFFATELGYTKFANAKNNMYATLGTSSGIVNANVQETVTTDAFDLVGKFILPLQNNFSVYGKAGAAVLRSNDKVNFSVSNPTTIFTAEGSSKNTCVYPTFGAGLAYDLTQKVSTDVSWNHIQKVGSNNDTANTDLFGLGLAYHFG